MKTHYTFKDIQDFENFLQTKEWKEGELDNVTIAGKVFTMHEYDSSGQYMSWANKKHGIMVDCETTDRYISFSDAKVSQFDNDSLRNDISYAE